MSKVKHSMTPLKDIIQNLFSDGTLPFNPDDASIWKVWEEALGAIVTHPKWTDQLKNFHSHFM